MSRRGVSEIDSDLHILEQRLKSHVETGMISVLDIAQNISDCCQDDEDLKTTARQMMVDFIDLEKEIQHQVTALNQIKQLSGDLSDPIRCLDETVSELQAYNTIDPKSHSRFKEMEEKLEAKDNTIDEEQFESLKATLLGSSEDDDIALTQTEVNTKCPYSGMTIVHPVKNTACGHVYDRDPILEHIKARKGRAKCPVGGCGNSGFMDAKKLVEFKELKMYLDYLKKKGPTPSSSSNR